MSTSSATIIERFDRDGYLVIPDFLSSTELHELVAQINRHYRSIQDTFKEKVAAKGEAFDAFATEVISWDPISERNPFFVALCGSERFKTVTAACIGEDFVGDQSLVMLSPPGGKGQAWHQDAPVGKEGHYNVNRLFYVEDVTAENGSIVVVPGSHRMGTIPKGGPQEPISGEVALMPSAGTLVLLNGLVYHRVTPNRSAFPRTSVNFRAYPAGVPTDLTKIGVYRTGAFDFRTNTIVKEETA